MTTNILNHHFKIINVILFLVAILLLGCDFEKPKVTLGTKYNKEKRKNVILMIADGCGLNHIQAANLYEYDEYNKQPYQQFPVKYYVSTFPAKAGKFKTEKGLNWNTGYNSFLAHNDSTWRRTGYTGSGASATAMATGKKTYNASIGMDYNLNPIKSITELAIEKNMGTGVVTSVQFAHATPASFIAHNKHRNNYEEIAREMLESEVDVIMGCGHPNYDEDGLERENKNYEYVGGEVFWNGYKRKNDRIIIDSKDKFRDLITDNQEGRKVLGLAPVAETLQLGRSGDINAKPFEVPLNKNLPSLEEMSLGAINVLDKKENGFFLMIEGGAVDWASHSNISSRMIEEEIAFNNVVKSVINWIETNSSWEETLLIITADHETGYLTGTNGYNSNITSNGKGNIPDMKWNSTGHTNVLIPLFAKGMGSELFESYADEVDSLRGYYVQNSEIGQILFRVLE